MSLRLQREINELRGQINTMQQSITGLAAVCNEQKVQIAQLNQYVEELHARIDVLTTKAEKLKIDDMGQEAAIGAVEKKVGTGGNVATRRRKT